MGLRLTRNGVDGYLKIDSIIIAERDVHGAPSGGNPLPHRINVFYVVTKDKGNKEILTKGELAIDYDLEAKENVLKTAYKELKARVPMLKDATDDI